MGRWHADAVRRIGGRVTVIIDPDAKARKELGRLHPEALLVPELDAAAVKSRATAAHVCTPLSTHVPVVTTLLDVGMHVLAEKPLTDSAESTNTLLSLARERGVSICPVHQFLFQDGVQRLIAWLPALGQLRRIEFSAMSAGAAGNDPASLDALIGEILPHPLAILTGVLRTPVAQLDWQVVHPSPGEFRALATSGGAVIDLAISAHGRPTENALRVVGDGGSVRADLFHGFAVRHAAAVSRRAKIVQPFAVSARSFGGASANLVRRAARREPAYPGLRSLVRAFYAAIASGRPAPIAPEQTADVAAARDRLLRKVRGA
jgi:predicted dehydrogenase